MFSKKIIHLFFIFHKNILLLKSIFLPYLLFSEKKSLSLNNMLMNQFIIQQAPFSFLLLYNLQIFIKTKHLFLFTIYVLFTKISNLLNFYTFKFHITLKKQKKITILRAPCNHKNSKEQYGLTSYIGKLQSYVTITQNLLYHKYLLTFLVKQQSTKFFNFNYIFLSNNAYQFNK